MGQEGHLESNKSAAVDEAIEFLIAGLEEYSDLPISECNAAIGTILEHKGQLTLQQVMRINEEVALYEYLVEEIYEEDVRPGNPQFAGLLDDFVLDEARRIAQADPENLQAQLGLVISLIRVSEGFQQLEFLKDGSGITTPCREVSDESVELAEKLVEKEPKNADFRETFIEALENKALSYSEKEPQTALATTKRWADFAEGVAREDLDDGDAADESLRALESLLLAETDPQEKLGVAQRALAFARDSLTPQPDDPAARRRFSEAVNNFVDPVTTSDPELGLEMNRQALNIEEEFASQGDNDAEDLDLLSQLLTRMARLLEKSDPQESIVLYQRAITIAGQIAELEELDGSSSEIDLLGSAFGPMRGLIQMLVAEHPDQALDLAFRQLVHARGIYRKWPDYSNAQSPLLSALEQVMEILPPSHPEFAGLRAEADKITQVIERDYVAPPVWEGRLRLRVEEECAEPFTDIDNLLEVEGPFEDVVDFLTTFSGGTDDNYLLGNILPEPNEFAGTDVETDWCLWKWGTRQELHIYDCLSLSNVRQRAHPGSDVSLSFQFESRMAPPATAVLHMAKMYPTLLFTLAYWYAGDNNPCLGRYIYEEGEITEELIDEEFQRLLDEDAELGL